MWGLTASSLSSIRSISRQQQRPRASSLNQRFLATRHSVVKVAHSQECGCLGDTRPKSQNLQNCILNHRPGRRDEEGHFGLGGVGGWEVLICSVSVHGSSRWLWPLGKDAEGAEDEGEEASWGRQQPGQGSWVVSTRRVAPSLSTYLSVRLSMCLLIVDWTTIATKPPAGLWGFVWGLLFFLFFCMSVLVEPGL